MSRIQKPQSLLRASLCIPRPSRQASSVRIFARNHTSRKSLLICVPELILNFRLGHIQRPWLSGEYRFPLDVCLQRLGSREYITRGLDAVTRLECSPNRAVDEKLIITGYWPNIQLTRIKDMFCLCLSQLYVLLRETDIPFAGHILPFSWYDMTRYDGWFAYQVWVFYTSFLYCARCRLAFLNPPFSHIISFLIQLKFIKCMMNFSGCRG